MATFLLVTLPDMYRLKKFLTDRLSKKTEWLGAGVVICLERHADLHMAQLMPLPFTVSYFSKIHIGFTFLVPAHPCSPGKKSR